MMIVGGFTNSGLFLLRALDPNPTSPTLRKTYRLRSRAEYRLTVQGRDLYPVLLALPQWSDR
jgi:hypothetical protein